ncbi:MAG: hypothetical protein WCK74_07480 [Gemmatimonadaceae bacterium]
MIRRLAVCALLALGRVTVAEAQALPYPSLQSPVIAVRDYTVAVVGGSGTSAVAQWREGLGTGRQFAVEAGFSTPARGVAPLVFVAASVAKALQVTSPDVPLAFAATAGLGLAAGGGSSVVRMPVGVSVGRTITTDEGTITPYVHPRLTFEACDGDVCRNRNRYQSGVSLDLDVGAVWQVNPRFAIRAALGFTGSSALPSGTTLATGVTWTPPALAGKGR